jgi:hypothetical protein
MNRIILHLPSSIFDLLRKHLLPETPVAEEAAFIFVRGESETEEVGFQFVDWWPLGAHDLETNTAWYLEVTDEAKAKAIKRAHNLEASLVEFHSHLGKWPAQFSPSDWAGFREIVPHCLWRLKGRPYLAVVVAQSGFDGLVWAKSAFEPQRLDAIKTETQVFYSTGLSLRSWEEGDNERTV